MTAPATFPTPTPDTWLLGPSTTGAAYCPTCLGVLPGWLAGCTKPACRRADHNYDTRIDRANDI
ncbi:hypothetical protein ABZ949_02640 [Micromonospora tulbaghiae]|uniref:hypothetical protein n=1 Tax=Micromonospora tulbaghiae TaxID=479978 RepID=UPI0033EEA06A